MKILNRLTIKHLKMNPKRTIVTIIGIVLSMALMLGCGLLASSFIESMKQEAIMLHGEYHAAFKSLSKKEAQEIENNIHINNSYFSSLMGFGEFLDSQNYAKPYYAMYSASKELLETFQLKEGRLPENEHEILVSNHVTTNGMKTVSIGEELVINVGKRYVDGEITYLNDSYEEGLNDHLEQFEEQRFTVVGIISRPYTESYTAAGYSLFTLGSNYLDEGNNVFVEYKKPQETFEISDEIINQLNLNNKSVAYNSSLLYFYGTTRYGNINESIMKVLCFALCLLSVGCVIVIYNSFAISTMERKKQFGLYASIGATRKQILQTVFFEAFLVGSIGIVLGIASSFLGIYVVLEILNYLLKDFWAYEFHLIINWIYIIVPILFMVFVVFFSAFLPARRASRVAPIISIRENDEIKMPKRKLKTPKFVTKLFGIEGELALKNMKRNKRKYRITVLSLFVSIVLFISFSTYLNYGVSTMDSVDRYDFDISMETYNLEGLQTLKEIRHDNRVDTSYLFRLESYSSYIPMDSYVSWYRNYLRNYELESSNMNLFILEDEDFDQFRKTQAANFDDILLLNQGQVIDYQNGNRETYQGKLFQQDISHLNLCYWDDAKDDEVCNIPLSNIKMITEVPPTFQYLLYNSSHAVFLSASKYQELFSDVSTSFNTVYNLNIQAKEYESLYNEIEKKYGNFQNMNMSSPKMEQKESKNLVLAVKILLYGFISLVTLIGVTSVFNTIHTSINLRRKEFAMLRSMGLTPKGFNKMILFESLFFGLKSLIYGIPVSFLCVLYIHDSMSGFSTRDHMLIPWGAICFVVIGVFLIVLLAMRYSVHKIKKENILNAIRDENI